MKRIYIAGPRTGFPEHNFPAFNRAAAEWRALGWKVLNPAESFAGDTGRPYKDYVDHDIDLLKKCDAIALLDGWDGDGARGSVWEWAIAQKLLDMDIYRADKPVPPR